jgi:hypothetical protein
VEISVVEQGGAVWAVEGAAATVSVSAASSCSVSATSRGKRAEAQGSVRGGRKRTKALMQPLRIPLKSLSNSSDDGGGGDRFTFVNMMHMVMI